MIVLTSRPAMIAFFRFAIYAPFNGDGNASGCSPEAFSMLLNHQFSMTNSGIAVDGIQKSCIMSGPPPASLWDAIKYACASTEGENDHPRASEIIRAFSPSTVCGLSMPPMKNPHGSPLAASAERRRLYAGQTACDCHRSKQHPHIPFEQYCPLRVAVCRARSAVTL